MAQQEAIMLGSSIGRLYLSSLLHRTCAIRLLYIFGYRPVIPN